ncbi:hypothetical protein KC19_3G250800 [Ceratodon purpureus]|uniref:Uncharacterized protein n=1 Tax=Ceratodon purpureus TaxID=3225 RepID=A0A8T0IMM5_CERPU|nr:hypothetical protein KC19_3G250800 [Ceratodon purpureus]
MLITVPVQRAIHMPATALKSRQSYPLPARSAPIRRRQAPLSRPGTRRRLRHHNRRHHRRRHRHHHPLLTTLLLRRLHQHTLPLHRRRRLRVHHQITITLGTQPHRRLAPEEPAHVLAHLRPGRRLRCRLLRYTLRRHLSSHKKRSAHAPPKLSQNKKQPLLTRNPRSNKQNSLIQSSKPQHNAKTPREALGSSKRGLRVDGEGPRLGRRGDAVTED